MDANFNDPEKDLLPCPAGLHFFVEKCGCDHPKDLAGKTVTTAPGEKTCFATNNSIPFTFNNLRKESF